MNAQTAVEETYKRKSSIKLASAKNKSNLKLAVQTSSLTPLVDGQEIFSQIGKDIKSAKEYIYIAGWMIHLNLTLNGTNLESLLLSKASENVNVRILWSDLDPIAGQFNEKQAKTAFAQNIELSQANRLLKKDKTGNIEIIITEMKDISLGGQALQTIAEKYMNRRVLIGSHHQKFVVIDGKIAIVGGIDLTVHSKSPSKWHDVSVRIFGKGVNGVEKNFVDRWNNEKSDNQKSLTLNNKSKDSDLCKTILTLPSWYWDKNEILDEYISLINNAKKSIYLENQYIREPKIAEALLNAVKKGIKTTIVIPTLPEEIEHDGNKPQLHNKISVYIQYKMLKTLTTQNEDTLTVPYQTSSNFKDKPNKRLQILSPSKKNRPYIHAKIMIVDGEYSIIGSANLNGKSLRGDSDSEICASISDKDFAQRLASKIQSRSDTWSLKEHNLTKTEKVSRITQAEFDSIQKIINKYTNSNNYTDMLDSNYWIEKSKNGAADFFDDEISEATNPTELRDAFSNHDTILSYI